ncbi:MAG: NAD-dependent epimerase/dehydratase family protein [Actinomycetales bacterium]|nr:NAD-dependent epimerase/dehydratase family protein [Actinomycetales bacterium]
MKTLILGGSTFVGRRMVDLLVGEGHDVAVLNRGRTASSLPEGVSRIVGDRTSTESMRAALGGTEWDAVIDVSGFVMAAGGGEFEDLLGLLDGSVGAYVFVSSIMAYEPSGVMPWTEDAPWTSDPVTTYGGFKAHAERAILERHRATGFPGSIARPAAIYGPDNNIHDMETAMFLRLRRGLPILLPHEGLVTTSYGHVDDLCLNLREMAQLPAAAGEIVNITGQGASSRAWTRLLADIVDVEPDLVEVPTGFTEAKPLYGHLFGIKHHGVLSVAKAAALGLTVERGIRRGYEQTYEWFLASPLVDAPDQLSDPVWGAGYDFALEAEVAAALRA